MKRITLLAAAGALVATPALGAWAAVAATDDHPAPGVSHVRVADRRGEAEPGDDHGRAHAAHHRHHGGDDFVTHVRNRTEPEPGDDNGRRAEQEPGDDNGGRAEQEPGDDNGGHHGGGDNGGHHGGGDDGGHHGGGDDGSGHH